MQALLADIGMFLPRKSKQNRKVFPRGRQIRLEFPRGQRANTKNVRFQTNEKSVPQTSEQSVSLEDKQRTDSNISFHYEPGLAWEYRDMVT